MQAQAQIIDQILDSARAIQGVLRAEPQRVSLDLLVEQAAAMAERALGASAPPIELRHESRPLSLEVDAARLQRAIANLVVNAAKYRPKAEPVRVLSHASAAGVEIRVTHAGGGIDARALARNVHGDGAPKLDLQTALARQLVELQGGSLVLRAAGNAAQPTLVIRLPAKTLGRPPKAVRVGFGTPLSVRARLDGVHVLLVEDDRDALDFLSLILRQAGATVTPFPLAAPAFDFFAGAEAPPDIIVSDIAMPLEDGYSLLARMRALEARQGRIPVPAVAVSAFSRDEDVQRALSHGFDRHVAKPVDALALIDIIASWTKPRQ